MGAWGVKALQSDAGLDIIDLIEDLFRAKDEIVMSEVISNLVKEDGLSLDLKRIEFFFDNTAMALSELYLEYKQNGEVRFENEDPELSLNLKKSLLIDKGTLLLLLRYLEDIKNEVPDEDGIREIVELWKDSDVWEEWKAHLLNLHKEIANELKSFK
jgi:hypothetical protein